ncbi:DUF7848 domain-containing protein [Streptomyces sp. URMC 129]|uniref:DUF7848 domain-containing protein n=1 Tax=Streptomyces sp. URMC 129 TaxID=3423407 RepID=UPI003F52CC37
MCPRAIVSHSEWMLTEEIADGAPRPVFHVECLECGARFEAVDNEPEPVEFWALKHTGVNPAHRQFKAVTEWRWRVIPAPDNPRFALEQAEESPGL